MVGEVNKADEWCHCVHLFRNRFYSLGDTLTLCTCACDDENYCPGPDFRFAIEVP